MQVRGPTPCCVLRALINFIDLHLDDLDLDLIHLDLIHLDLDPDEAPAAADDAEKSSNSVLSTVLSSDLDRAALCDGGSVVTTESFHRFTPSISHLISSPTFSVLCLTFSPEC